MCDVVFLNLAPGLWMETKDGFVSYWVLYFLKGRDWECEHELECFLSPGTLKVCGYEEAAMRPKPTSKWRREKRHLQYGQSWVRV